MTCLAPRQAVTISSLCGPSELQHNASDNLKQVENRVESFQAGVHMVGLHPFSMLEETAIEI